MTSNHPESQVPQESSLDVSRETTDLVEREMPNETDEVKRQTEALIEGIKRRAQTEVQNAENLTREAYLNAVNQAREAVEEHQWIDPNRIEKSIELVQKDAERNWQSILQEIEDFGDRLAEAAKAAWEVLTQQDKKDDQPK
jgi:vacuolar-type H+-ATPase subunit H